MQEENIVGGIPFGKHYKSYIYKFVVEGGGNREEVAKNAGVGDKDKRGSKFLDIGIMIFEMG